MTGWLAVRTPAPDELLDVWDHAAVWPSAARVAGLLRLATGLTSDEVDALEIGARDRLVVELRQRLFGVSLRTVVECPTCGLALEVELRTGALLRSEDGADVMDVAVDRYRVRVRPLRVGDLADAAATGTPVGARALLVQRSVEFAERDGDPIAVTELPSRVIAAVGVALADAHPLVDVVLPITCEACGSNWTCLFDIATYLWQELDAWATRVLGEVHTLASAYGWSEAEIVALTPTRRRHYLELVGDD